MGTDTKFLYAEPSFIEGIARIFDFTGTLNVYNISPTGEIADELAMCMDWVQTSDDIRSAFDRYRREYHKELQETET